MPKIITPMLAEIGKGNPPSRRRLALRNQMGRRPRHLRHRRRQPTYVLAQWQRHREAIPRAFDPAASCARPQAILDGEIAALDDKGRPSFRIASAPHAPRRRRAIARLAPHHPVALFRFRPALSRRPRPSRRAPGRTKKLLEEILTPSDDHPLFRAFRRQGAELLDAAKQQGLEGVDRQARAIAFTNRADPPTGVKWKVVDSSDFVICGFTPKASATAWGAGSRRAEDRRQTRWAGNVGTGFDGQDGVAGFAKLAPLVVAKVSAGAGERSAGRRSPGRSRELVLRGAFRQRTEEGRLRAPVFLSCARFRIPAGTRALSAYCGWQDPKKPRSRSTSIA